MAGRATRMAQRKVAMPSRGLPEGEGLAGGEVSEHRFALPLSLRAMVSPYKKQGRLVIRVERMQPRARLSAGRNNGDNTWSLTLDELEDLLYLPPAEMKEPHTLAIRVTVIDTTGGTTAALLDYDISPDGSVPIAAVGQDASNADAVEQLGRLREELAQIASRLIARETELAAARQDTQSLRAELTDARDGWQKELDALTAEADGRASDRIAETREQSARDTEAALARAADEWKSGEAARLAAAEARWRERAERMLADARTAAEHAANREQAEIGRLGDELAGLRKRLAERDDEMARLQSVNAQVRAGRETELREALVKAEAGWKSEEAARLAAAEASWRERAERMLADARAASENAGTEEQVELDRLNEELAGLREQLAGRDDEIAQLRSAAAQARADWQTEFRGDSHQGRGRLEIRRGRAARGRRSEISAGSGARAGGA